jgi:hypothetical protein
MECAMGPEVRSLTSSGDVSGDEMFRMLQAHFEPGKRKTEQRRSERKPWLTGLTVWFEDHYSPLGSTREIQAATLNVSRGGLSFLAERFFHEGAQMRVRFNVFPNGPTVAGLARSCEHFGGAWYRVGMEFAMPTEPA